MTEDPIVDEVRRWREEYAAQFDFNLDAIFDDLRRRTEQAHQAGLAVVNAPPRPVESCDRATPTERRAG